MQTMLLNQMHIYFLLTLMKRLPLVAMMLTPRYLTTSQSEEHPQADHTLLLKHDKTTHHPLQGRTHSLEGNKL